ncbi:hypothetical protein Cadr_000012454 [Camelus dromedarius]|uniref:Uncharacterized protein n=1 Tax=Camelus dromedarius TaxID=9838 RepID=A0A5N4D9L3_CAMDR|nr:hypothetical protein Cadr_000012454 [Camelus dromedarius]
MERVLFRSLCFNTAVIITIAFPLSAHATDPAERAACVRNSLHLYSPAAAERDPLEDVTAILNKVVQNYGCTGVLPKDKSSSSWKDPKVTAMLVARRGSRIGSDDKGDRAGTVFFLWGLNLELDTGLAHFLSQARGTGAAEPGLKPLAPPVAPEKPSRDERNAER